MTYDYSGALRNRFNFLRLGDTPELIGSDDLWMAMDCTVSPDGRWFIYSEPAGPNGQGRLFLKKIQP